MELGFHSEPYLRKRWPNRSVYTFTITLTINALKEKKREERKKRKKEEAWRLSSFLECVQEEAK